MFGFCLVQDVQASTELARIAGEFADQEELPENPSSDKGDDLLAMMDDLWLYVLSLHFDWILTVIKVWWNRLFSVRKLYKVLNNLDVTSFISGKVTTSHSELIVV